MPQVSVGQIWRNKRDKNKFIQILSYDNIYGSGWTTRYTTAAIIESLLDETYFENCYWMPQHSSGLLAEEIDRDFDLYHPLKSLKPKIGELPELDKSSRLEDIE